MDEAEREAMLHRKDIRREMELVDIAITNRGAALIALLELYEGWPDEERLKALVQNATVAEAELHQRLRDLFNAFIETFPDLPEAERRKPN